MTDSYGKPVTQGRSYKRENLFSKTNSLFFIAMIFGLLASVAIAESISGIVTNKSSNKPAAGDDVVLIRLTQGMQESARTKTDSHGHYTLDVPEQGFHLLRVTHDKANYFKPIQPGMKTVDIDVYSSATQVKGVVGEADVMRLQTDESGKTLRVIEVFFLRNNSSPPMTQFGPRPFEFYLPQGAVVQGSAAVAPGGMPVQAAPVPLDGQNHYAFIFPIRPGETHFQVSYTLPYSGSLHLAPKPILPTDVVAIIIPKSISFRAGQSAPYNAIQDDLNLQTFVARDVLSSQSLDFTISGTGQLPPETQTPSGGDQQPNSVADTSGAAASDTRPGGGLGNPIDPAGTILGPNIDGGSWAVLVLHWPRVRV
jgi:hypothetical protein